MQQDIILMFRILRATPALGMNDFVLTGRPEVDVHGCLA